MSASGLFAADLDNTAVMFGITREFFTTVGKHYGADFSLGASDSPISRSRFEPHVAEALFNEFAAAVDVPVFHNKRLDLNRGVLLRNEFRTN